ncbi:MAG: threonine/serine exporter family protein [Verrucomicrobiota bacterium]
MNTSLILHQTICGALAAAGFGVLFNVGFRQLPWYATCGAVALGVRTIFLQLDWTLEGATFAAALTAGVAAQGLRLLRPDTAHHALDVVGCIPLVPGSFAAKTIIGLYALTSEHTPSNPEAFMVTVQYLLRVIFTLGAIGTGLAMPALLRRMRMGR